MKAIFYRSKYGSAFSTAIDYWTTELGWNPMDHWRYIRNPQGYSHSEVCFSKEATLWYLDMLFQNNPPEYWKLNEISSSQIASSAKTLPQIYDHTIEEIIHTRNLRLCFSASEKDKCVRLKLIDVEPHKWDAIECEGDLAMEKMAIKHCKIICGQEYDYLGLMGFLSMNLHIIKPSTEKWWCSETTAYILCLMDFIDGPSTPYLPPSPNELYKQLAAMPQPLRIK